MSNPEKIQHAEQSYGVNVETVMHNNVTHYEITAAPTGTGEYYADNGEVKEYVNPGYRVVVRPDYSNPDINPNAAETLGVQQGPNEAQNLINMHRAMFEQQHGNVDEWRETLSDHTASPLHRVAVVAGAARTNFQLPTAFFAQDPSFGASGAGPNIVPYGDNGGFLSVIGIAHDTDWLRGYFTNDGPLWPLGQLEGEVPSGLHGLPTATRASFDLGERRRAENQRETVPALENVQTYDTPAGHPDWDIDILMTREEYDRLGIQAGAGEVIEVDGQDVIAIGVEELDGLGLLIDDQGMIARQPLETTDAIMATEPTDPLASADQADVEDFQGISVIVGPEGSGMLVDSFGDRSDPSSPFYAETVEQQTVVADADSLETDTTVLDTGTGGSSFKV